MSEQLFSLLPDENSASMQEAIRMYRYVVRMREGRVYVKAHTRVGPKVWEKNGPKPLKPALVQEVKAFERRLQKVKGFSPALVRV